MIGYPLTVALLAAYRRYDGPAVLDVGAVVDAVAAGAGAAELAWTHALGVLVDTRKAAEILLIDAIRIGA